MAPVPRLRPYAGPALFSYGFRPFFLLGTFHAGAAVVTWLPVFTGELALPTAFAPRGDQESTGAGPQMHPGRESLAGR